MLRNAFIEHEAAILAGFLQDTQEIRTTSRISSLPASMNTAFFMLVL
jgi:hypothetical protein